MRASRPRRPKCGLKLSGVAARVPALARPPWIGNGNGHSDGHCTRSPARRTVARTAAAALPSSEPPLIVRDVELMRRLYRSGESEYLIDGEICRLRDVQDLLMDAGVGVKAYAVIEQGKIGQILSARPTDRRQLIEEAAGVTKYKTRRRAAELKLEAAQQNLTRVDDIVFEVEKQRGTLKRQAAKARRYKRLRDELRRWEKVQFAAALPRAGRGHRVRAATQLADARERETAAAAHVWRKSKRRSSGCGWSWPRRTVRRPRARDGARERARDRPPAAADRVRSPADRDAGARQPRKSARK